MNVRAVLNLSLLALAAVLVVLVFWQPGIKQEPALPKLTGLAPAQVEHVAIRAQNGAEIRIDKDQGIWMMRAPVATYANEFRIDSLLRIAQADSHARIDVQGLDLAKFRLDQPQVVLHLNDIELDFGDSDPINNRRYVRAGSTVHLIDDDYFYRLQAGFPAFVSNQILPPQGKPVMIRLPAFSVARAEGGQWTLTPAGKPVSMDAINAFVEAWGRAQAVEIDRYQGEPSQGVVAVSIEGAEAPLQFLLLETEPELILARADLGLRYHLAGDQAQRLLHPPSATAEGGGEH